MHHRIAATFALAVAAAGCVKDVSRVHRQALPRLNPTSYSFDIPLGDLRAKAMAAFSIDHQVKQPVFGSLSTVALHAFGGMPILHVSVASDAGFGAELFRIPENAHDLYLQSFGVPVWESPVYHGSRGGLPFIAEFHVHFSASEAGRTSVAVRALRTEVINGMHYGLGSCGPGWAWRYVPVEPTSIEEYLILRYIGEAVGAPAMPEVVLPTA
jgi:hypothetical protein